MSKSFILSQADGLSVGHSLRGECPVCGQQEMSITRTNEGILYNCFRASCPTSGFIPTGGVYLPPERHVTQKTTRPYTGPILPPTPEDQTFFFEYYELPPSTTQKHIHRGAGNRYILPILSPRGLIRGYILRAPWKHSPLWTEVGDISPKSLTRMHSQELVQSIYYPTLGMLRDDKAVLVEDQLSALKVAEEGFLTIAAMGMPGSDNLSSNAGVDKVREIAGVIGRRELLVALDKDATAFAFRWARKWSLAFPKLRVVMLDQDLKDTPRNDIIGILS